MPTGGYCLNEQDILDKWNPTWDGRVGKFRIFSSQDEKTRNRDFLRNIYKSIAVSIYENTLVNCENDVDPSTAPLQMCNSLEKVIQHHDILDLGAGRGHYGRCFLRVKNNIIKTKNKAEIERMDKEYAREMERGGLTDKPQVVKSWTGEPTMRKSIIYYYVSIIICLFVLFFVKKNIYICFHVFFYLL